MYRVQINIFRAHNEGSHNMRTFEMPGLGCIMVAPRSDEHTEFFKDNKEAFFYDSKEMLAVLVGRLLMVPYNDCLKTRHNALNRSIKSGYDYKSRAKQALDEITQLFNK